MTALPELVLITQWAMIGALSDSGITLTSLDVVDVTVDEQSEF